MGILKAKRTLLDITTNSKRPHRVQPIGLPKLSFTINVKRKTFHDKSKFKQNLPTNQGLQKTLEGFQPEAVNHSKKTWRINNLTPANQYWGWETPHNKKVVRINKHYLWTKLDISGFKSSIKRQRPTDWIQNGIIIFGTSRKRA